MIRLKLLIGIALVSATPLVSVSAVTIRLVTGTISFTLNIRLTEATLPGGRADCLASVQLVERK